MESIKLTDVIRATNGYLESDVSISEVYITGVSTDSRKIHIGDLYIPIIGENFDGHEFIEEAFQKGAVACISEKRLMDTHNSFVIQVMDTKKALLDLAAYYRLLFKLPVIAVTGSVGKTTTKDMIASVLSMKYNVLKTQGNYNNEIGLPLTIFQLERRHTALVLEMGMSRLREIHNLSWVAKPDVAVITNIGVSHIENLGSQEGILQAKSEIFDFMWKDGIAVLNGDDPFLDSLKHTLKHKTVFYGIDNKKEYYASNISMEQWNSTKATVFGPDQKFDIEIPSPGKHMIYNTLSAIIIGMHFGLEPSQIQEGIKRFVPTEMRMGIYETSYNLTIINDAYNASPDSMKAAIDVLVSMPKKGRKVAILGDMLEMGEYSGNAHQDVGMYAAAKKLDVLLCVGKEAKEIYEGARSKGLKDEQIHYYPDQEELLNALTYWIQKKDTILVKASRGMHLERTIEKIEEVKQ